MKDSIEINNKGIKLSYRRFISDTAIGLSLIAIVIFIVSDSWQNFNILKDATTSDKVFIYTLIFMLATPLGLLVNISSWILFGFFQYYLSKDIILKCDNMSPIGNFIFYSTNNRYRISEMKKFYKLDKDNFYRIVKKIETFLDMFMKDSISYKENLIGMRIFYRNVSFILLIVSFVMFFKNYNISFIFITFSFSLFFLIANTILNTYYIFYHLIRFHHLILADEYSPESKRRFKVINEKEIDIFIDKLLNHRYRKEINKLIN